MSVDSVLENLRRDAARIVPEANILSASFEAHRLVLVTDTPSAFDGPVIGQIAKTLRKRIVVRADPKVLPSPEEAEAALRSVVPPDAKIQRLTWNRDAGTVLVEAENPGDVIGASGATLQKIRGATGWSPDVARSPTLPSTTVSAARQVDQHAFLADVGSSIHRAPGKERWARLTALAGWRGDGAATLIETADAKLLVDTCLAGHDLDSERGLDGVILTSASAGRNDVQALIASGYEGPFYTTAPTRDLIAAGLDDPNPFLLRTIALPWSEPTDIAPGVRVTLQPSGRMLGSSVVHLHLTACRHNLVITGDIRTARSPLCGPASGKFPRVDTLVLTAPEPPHPDAATAFKQVIERLLDAGPVTVAADPWQVAEAALVIGELGATVSLSPPLREALAIHTAYVEFYNEGLRQRMQREDPFAHVVEDGQIQMKTPAESEGMVVLIGSAADKDGTIRIDGFAGGADRRGALNYTQHVDPKPRKVLVQGPAQAAADTSLDVWKRLRIHSAAPANGDIIALGDDPGDGVQ